MHVARPFRRRDGASVTSLYFIARPIGERETQFHWARATSSQDQPGRGLRAAQHGRDEQDRRIVEAQRPEELPLDLSAELPARVPTPPRSSTAAP
jgi:hypothetical protein